MRTRARAAAAGRAVGKMEGVCWEGDARFAGAACDRAHPNAPQTVLDKS